jgi:hypothetical protein
LPVITDNEELWYCQIVENITAKANIGRAILIISRYIENVYELNRRFLEINKNLKIFLYTGQK